MESEKDDAPERRIWPSIWDFLNQAFPWVVAIFIFNTAGYYRGPASFIFIVGWFVWKNNREWFDREKVLKEIADGRVRTLEAGGHLDTAMLHMFGLRVTIALVAAALIMSVKGGIDRDRWIAREIYEACVIQDEDVAANRVCSRLENSISYLSD